MTMEKRVEEIIRMASEDGEVVNREEIIKEMIKDRMDEVSDLNFEISQLEKLL